MQQCFKKKEKGGRTQRSMMGGAIKGERERENKNRTKKTKMRSISICFYHRVRWRIRKENEKLLHQFNAPINVMTIKHIFLYLFSFKNKIMIILAYPLSRYITSFKCKKTIQVFLIFLRYCWRDDARGLTRHHTLASFNPPFLFLVWK